MLLLTARANALGERGDRTAALVELRTAYALELEHEAELDPTACFASQALAFALLADGAVSEALTILESVTARLHEAGVEDPERLVGLETAQALSAMGDASGADAVLQRIAARATMNGDDTRLARALCLRADVAIQRGDLEHALEHAQTAHDLATSVGDRNAEAVAVDHMGTVQRLRGRFDQAADDHAAAVEAFRAAGSPRDELIALLNLAEARYCAGDADGAEETLIAINAHLTGDSAPPMLWNAHLLSALVIGERGDWPAARDALRTALELLHGSDLPGASGSARQRLRREERVHRLAINAAVRAGDGDFALEILEAGRARFLRTVMERRRRRPAGTAETDWLRYERSADALAELRVRRRTDLLSPDPELARESSAAEREHAEAAAAVFGEHEPEEIRTPFPRFDDLLRPLPAGVAVVALDVVEDGIQLVCAGRDASGAAVVGGGARPAHDARRPRRTRGAPRPCDAGAAVPDARAAAVARRAGAPARRRLAARAAPVVPVGGAAARRGHAERRTARCRTVLRHVRSQPRAVQRWVVPAGHRAARPSRRPHRRSARSAARKRARSRRTTMERPRCGPARPRRRTPCSS